LKRWPIFGNSRQASALAIGGVVARNIFYISAIVLCFLVYREYESGPIEHAPGVLVAEQPRQENVGNSVFGIDDYILTRRARFEIRARVLSTERYYLRNEGDLSPIDLALGWGPMSDQSVLDQIKISQSGRWYRTRYDLPGPIPEQQLINSSSNMHMIPARPEIAKRLKKLQAGEVVVLEGYLVDVDHPSGWFWRTSLTRNDTGNGACEIVYVESMRVDNPLTNN
jgi:hypothetical protein